MRLLVPLLLLAPLALAQAPEVELLSVEMEPFAEPAKPLQSPVSTTLRLRVSCTLAEPTGIIVTYTVTAHPEWASVVISPAADNVPIESCSDGYASREATLTAMVSDQAPAYAPARLEVEARAGTGSRQNTARAEAALEASYFSILDVQMPEASIVLSPGTSRDATLKVTNFGNGNTRVDVVLEPKPASLLVQVPPSFTLESKQAGGNRISEEVVVRIAAPPERGYVNRVEAFSVKLTSSWTGAGSDKGDSSTHSWVVTVRTAAEAAEKVAAIPAPAFAALVALALAARLSRPFRP